MILFDLLSRVLIILLSLYSSPSLYTMSSSAASTSTAVPQPENLFTGRLDYHMAAAVVYRVNRIGRALSSLVAGDVGNDKRRRRWRIGLYYEFVSALLRQVCVEQHHTTFFAHRLF